MKPLQFFGTFPAHIVQDDYLRRAFFEGVKAQADGLRFDTNPYDKNCETDQLIAWRTGHEIAGQHVIMKQFVDDTIEKHRNLRNAITSLYGHL